MCGCLGLTLSAAADTLTFVSRLPLPISGASAIEVDEDGGSALVLSDRGPIFRLQLIRDAGHLAEVTLDQMPPLSQKRDAEGLAIGPTGAFVSFEGPAEVRSKKVSSTLQTHPDFAQMADNRSLEALAIDPEGRLIAIPEGAIEGGFPIYRFEDGAWRIVGQLPRKGWFRPVGADIGPDGMLYLLERSFGWLGFRSRISRVSTDDSANREILLTTEAGDFDNLEGVSVWRTQTGTICFTMVSDDNFSSLQQAEIVEFALTETLAPGRGCD